MPDDRRRAGSPTRLMRPPASPLREAIDAHDETTRLSLNSKIALLRLEAATAELEESLETSRRCTEQVQQFAEDVDSDKISTDGMVLEPFEEEDTVVRHVRAALQDLAG